MPKLFIGHIPHASSDTELSEWVGGITGISSGIGANYSRPIDGAISWFRIRRIERRMETEGCDQCSQWAAHGRSGPHRKRSAAADNGLRRTRAEALRHSRPPVKTF